MTIENASWHKRLFLVSLSLVVFGLASSCEDESTQPETKPFGKPFVIENLGITFGPWDQQTYRAGDFLFVPQEQKVFLEFGAIVQAGGGVTKELPTFEYRIHKDAYVFAIAEGNVIFFEYQDATNDYAFSVRSRNDPDHTVNYDHVTEPTVGLGDRVQPGDTLGRPGTWSSPLGRFEIMINNERTGLSYCPFCCLKQGTQDSYRALVSQLMTDWERFKGDTSIYDESEHVAPGCRYETMVSY